MKKIELLQSDFDKLQCEIELLSDNVDEAYADRDQFESKLFRLLSVAHGLLAAAARYPAAGGPGGDGTSDAAEECRGGGFVRLPKIDLPHFDGDYQHWLSFRDTYISLIHDNTSINNVNKFHYLRAALTGSASLIIQSLDLTSENYSIAWQLLSDRYDNPRLLINNHISALFSVDPIQRESSSALRNIVDVTNKNLRALASLGEPTDHWDSLIVFLMSKKLDSSSYRQWEEHRNNLDSSPTLQQFIKFLINRADLLETLTDTFKYKQNNKPNNNNEAFKTKNFLVSTDNTRAYSCPMCSQSHGLFNCPSFKALDIDSRIKKAKESRVCMNCLRLGHVENACTLTHCKYCKYRHNTLLHKDVNKNTYTNKSASVPTTSGLANNVALSSDISPSTLNNHGSVLLSTALVKVADKHGSLHTARLLLDNGSTSNFVTQSLCEKLDLKSEGGAHRARLVSHEGGIPGCVKSLHGSPGKAPDHLFGPRFQLYWCRTATCIAWTASNASNSCGSTSGSDTAQST
ncbi:uncharacterized protein LOC105388792 isoform X1 [Plutella xylostella]|uniref:uncharacterized protein LOC105388792 isoform X1 n=2 Tax=Plutella xylostella TaxID=51655 RepID=UPI0020326581|nr:uncharacterized protein LOC105388792 isoform X1 [Plutella xylostella]